MKSFAKKVVVAVLGWQVRRLYKKNDFKVVAVAGSVGKTSTKLAIAQVLSRSFKVCYQDGNYNDSVSVPLIFFGSPLPSLFNPLAWLFVFMNNELQLLKKYPYQVVVVELSTDKPGEMELFKKYMKRVEIGTLTAISPEHMANFEDLDGVAREELVIAELCTLLLANKDMCDAKYLAGQSALTYAINNPADYQLTNLRFGPSGCDFDVMAGGSKVFSATHEAFAEPLLYGVLAAIAVAKKLGAKDEDIQAGLADIKPAAGRMQMLTGLNGSQILDDTYNASPEAVKAALATIYRLPAAHKIAILGNMNELGKFSESTHREIGRLCDPAKLELVVTIGPDANGFIAAEAEARGCQVAKFEDPYQAGEFVKSKLDKGTLVLAKGSQNGVFAEEAVKALLANPEDRERLVRQSKAWLAVKKKAFKV